MNARGIQSTPSLCLIMFMYGVLIALASDVGAGSFRAGVAAYQTEDYVEAHSIWSALASTEHVLAQYNLAIMYFAGRGAVQDHGQAMQWFWRAADNGFAPAFVNLANMFQDGLGSGQNSERALAYLIVAVDTLPWGQCRDTAIEQREAISVLLSAEELHRAEQIAAETLHPEGSVLSIYSHDGDCFDSIALGGGTIRTVSQPSEILAPASKDPELELPDRVVASDIIRDDKTAKRVARTLKAAVRRVYYVQVGALPTNAAARRLQAAVRERHAGTLGDHEMFIQEAQVAPLGTVFRVRVGPFSEKSDADGMCRTFRKSRKACFVVRRSTAS